MYTQRQLIERPTPIDIRFRLTEPENKNDPTRRQAVGNKNQTAHEPAYRNTLSSHLKREFKLRESE